MKIVVIGDIHGRDKWEKIVEENEGSTFIFLGDYLDPYEDIDDFMALLNLKRIVKFKKNNDNVHLLIGNHDLPYMLYPKHRPNALIKNTRSNESVSFFRRNKDHFKFSHQIYNKIFIHSGISEDWLNDNIEIFDSFGLNPDYSNLSDIINIIGKSKNFGILAQISKKRGGVDKFAGPLWSDKKELYYESKSHTLKNIIPNIHQYVGHSKVENIHTLGDENQSITFCNVLSESEDYLILDI